MSGLIEFIKKHGRKLSISAQEWVAEREKDQKRLDWIDKGDVAAVERLRAHMDEHGGSVREAIDKLMADVVEEG